MYYSPTHIRNTCAPNLGIWSFFYEIYTHFSLNNVWCLCSQCLFIDEIKLFLCFEKFYNIFLSLIAVYKKNLPIIGDFPLLHFRITQNNSGIYTYTPVIFIEIMKTVVLQSKNWKLLAMKPTCLEIIRFATIHQICRFFVLYQPYEFLLIVFFIWYSQNEISNKHCHYRNVYQNTRIYYILSKNCVSARMINIYCCTQNT